MIDLNKALFFDIETHRVKNWNERTPEIQRAFINHYYDPQTYDSPEDHFNEIAGLYAEFSQAICIVYGYQDITGNFRTTDLHGVDEVDILNKAKSVFKYFQSEGYFLVGHNILTCDIPYLVKRYIINSMRVPDFINSFGVKPWDQVHIDTMDLWKFGDYKRVSLETICATLGISCKSDELGGSNLYQYDISKMPWNELVHYCTEDVTSNYLMLKHILTYFDTNID